MTIRIAIGALIVVAILAIVFNPRLWGVLFAILVLIGAATLWFIDSLHQDGR